MTSTTSSTMSETLLEEFSKQRLVIPESVSTQGAVSFDEMFIPNLSEFERNGKPIRKTQKFDFYND